MAGGGLYEEEDGVDQQAPLLPQSSGQVVRRKKGSTLLTVCPFILGNEFCERLAFNGLATNFITYLTQVMGIDPAAAAIEVMMFEGTCYVTPVLGAYLADSFWGRYKTILVFSSIYLVGMALMALTSWLPGCVPAPGDTANLYQNSVLVGALMVVAIGTGGIKPNVSAFGADQFDETNPEDKREKQSFFNWFYLAINVGALIAVTAVVWVQDNVSWSLGFAIPAMAMTFAVLFFLAGRRRYRHVAPTESPMARVVKVVHAAIKNRYRPKRVEPPQLSALDGAHASGAYFQHAHDADGGPAAGPRDSQLRLPDTPQGSRDPLLRLPETPSKSYMWLEEAISEWQTTEGRVTHGGSLRHGGYTPKQVEEVKMVLRLLPVFVTTALYWTIYAQMGTMFIQQGSLMDNRVRIPWPSSSGLVVSIPSATMALFNTATIILLVPVYDRFFVPMLKRCGRPLTLLQRIGWGMLIAAIAMFYAAAVERMRLAVFREQHAGRAYDNEIEYDYSPTGSRANGGAPVHMSIMWQVPGYALIGLSEVFTSIGQLEFFYDQAPDVMRSCSMALQLLSTAVGSYLGGALVAAVQAWSSAAGCPWLPRDLNQGHMDWFLLAAGGVMLANTLLFVGVAVKYEYKAVDHRGALKVPVIEQPQPPQQPYQPPPPRPATPAAPSAPISAGARPVYTGRYRGPSVASTPTNEEEVYSRSLAYLPRSPALPAPFR